MAAKSRILSASSAFLPFFYGSMSGRTGAHRVRRDRGGLQMAVKRDYQCQKESYYHESDVPQNIVFHGEP
jgi:hypothetical protein